MVTFTCDLCNDALKKNKVIKHNSCRGATYTCIDCNVTFTRDTYHEHYKCVSEDQRYGGSNYVPKECKGEVKQQKWIDTVRSIAKRQKSGAVRDLLLKMCKNENLPRKKKAFMNFAKNALNCHKADLLEQVWLAIDDGVTKSKQIEESNDKVEIENKTDNLVVSPKKE